MAVHRFKTLASQAGRGQLRQLGVPAILLGNPRLLDSWQSYVISGTTLTGAGAALGGCDVHLFRTIDDIEVQMTTSDGSGLFAFDPINPGNGPWYVVAYKPGAPDLAGTTRNILIGTSSVNVYLRDPTAPDGAGAAVFRPVGSPIVRRISL